MSGPPGRCEESFGEDPQLILINGAAAVTGLTSWLLNMSTHLFCFLACVFSIFFPLRTIEDTRRVCARVRVCVCACVRVCMCACVRVHPHYACVHAPAPRVCGLCGRLSVYKSMSVSFRKFKR
jgi:hypothetical protein